MAAGLEFRGIDAVDARTGEPVWYHLVISARGLLDGNSERAGRTGDSEGVARADTPLVWTREETAPLSDRDLRSWYQQRIQGLLAWAKRLRAKPIGRQPNGDFLVELQGAGCVRCGKNWHLRLGRNRVANLLLRLGRNRPE